MRRKISRDAHAYTAPRAVRALSPSRVGGFLPTAASLALALAAAGCSTPMSDVIVADPVTKPAPAPTPAAAPSASTPYLDPDPHELDGDIAIVKPTPPPPTKKK